MRLKNIFFLATCFILMIATVSWAETEGNIEVTGILRGHSGPSVEFVRLGKAVGDELKKTPSAIMEDVGSNYYVFLLLEEKDKGKRFISFWEPVLPNKHSSEIQGEQVESSAVFKRVWVIERKQLKTVRPKAKEIIKYIHDFVKRNRYRGPKASI